MEPDKPYLLNRVIPLRNESLLGIMDRSSMANYYPSRRWLEDRLGVKVNSLGIVSPNLRYTTQHLEALSGLTRLPVDTLYKMTIHRFACQLCKPEEIVFDKDGREFLSYAYLLRFATTLVSKFCPACLQEERYHRLHWDLVYVTACIKHRLLLVDRCSNCGKKVMASEITAGYHKCGADLSREKADELGGTGLDLSSQAFLQAKLGVIPPMGGDKELGTGNPAFSLDAPSFFLLLDTMFGLLVGIELTADSVGAGKFDLAKKNGSPKKNIVSNKYRHDLICMIFHTLGKWPTNFHKFLEKYRHRGKKEERLGFMSRFECLARLYKVMEENEFLFLKKAFQDYLLTQSDKSLVRKTSKYFAGDEDELTRRKTISIKEASEILKLPYSIAKAWIEFRNIPTEYRRGEKRRSGIYLVAFSKLKRLFNERLNFFTVKEASEILGLPKVTTEELVASEMLPGKRIVPDRKSIIVKKKTIERFQQKLLAGEEIPQAETSALLTIQEVADFLGFAMHSAANVLKLAQDGVLKPYVEPFDRRVGSLRFRLSEIQEEANSLMVSMKLSRGWLVQAKSGAKQDNSDMPDILGKNSIVDVCLSLDKAGKLLGGSRVFLLKLIRCGLMAVVEKENTRGEKVKRVPLGAFYDFRARYMFVEEAEKILRVKAPTIRKWFKRGLIGGNASIKVSGRTKYLLNRSDVLKYRPENLFTMPAARKYLSCDWMFIKTLISKGMLVPICGPKINKFRRYKFLRTDVEKIKQGMEDLISLPDLAQLMGTSQFKIHDLVRLKEITPARNSVMAGNKDHFLYFRRSDVEPFIRAYSSSEAATMLRLNEQILRRLTKEGRIKALSGPSLDGKKYYRYRWIDIRAARNDKRLFVNKGNKIYHDLITAKEVGERLGMTKNRVLAMIAKGLLKPFCREKISGRQRAFLFRPSDIERFRRKFIGGLMSAADAADKLGEDLSHFYKKWVRSNRLTRIDFEDKLGKHFFLKEEIKKYLALKKETMTGPQTARILGVQRNKVFLWRKAGKLRAVSGPAIDGFGCYLYLKKDIENFCRERNGL